MGGIFGGNMQSSRFQLAQHVRKPQSLQVGAGKKRRALLYSTALHGLQTIAVFKSEVVLLF